MARNILMISVAFIVFASGTYSMASDVVIVNRPFSDDDKRYDYAHKLVSMALDVTENEYGEADIRYADQVMIRQRALTEMKAGDNIHVMAELTQPLWEENLIAIQTPIRKGISGFRIFLIKDEDQPFLSSINSLEVLKDLPMGIMRQWSTAQVLDANNFNLVFGTNFEGLFQMLSAGRFTTFARGVDEIFHEYETNKPKYPNLRIEEDLVLYIPAITYIFVTPEKPELADRLEKGLKILMDNGQFDAHFDEYYAEVIKRSRISERTMFEIPNSLLSDDLPLYINVLKP